MKTPIVYLILDGWGIAPPGPGNAIHLANTPNFNKLVKEYPYTEIGAGGEAVGLWKGHQGSSEIGHFIIGAGRNVHLPQGIVANAVTTGKVKENKAILNAIKYVKNNNSTLHLAGLMSDKGVHSYDIFMHSLIELGVNQGVEDIVVHFFTDGRDTAPYESKKYLKRLQKVFQENNAGKIGTVMGRYWAMDRDHRWKRIQKAYDAMVNGKAEYTAQSAEEAINKAYKRCEEAKKNKEDFCESDEFIKPTVIINEEGNPVGKIKDKDALIWTNFRTDRAIEITQAFVEDDFAKFERKKRLDIHYLCSFQYYEDVPAPYAFERVYPKNTFGEMISKAGLEQLRITETEKWIYVTTIFSGMHEEPFKGEERILIESDKIPTYDLKPKMHTMEIAQKAAEAIRSNKYELIFINFNNPDIIGHTGNIEATIKGVEECDKGIKVIIDAINEVDGIAVISADHGNAEVMLTENGEPHTFHTANKVPFIIVTDDPKFKNIKLRNGGALKDVTPTILDMLEIQKPPEMTGVSLINKN
ncbi:2,3-bisphosphoglycerate-independent phosphoglycerate mutase [Candidatus Dojkabacteria bacterium]|nr:2,3-bisphosphoglycerate-independent phosphoglycerate mutase [Candidatus Dojkabacteria bacterium]